MSVGALLKGVAGRITPGWHKFDSAVHMLLYFVSKAVSFINNNGSYIITV